METIKAIEKVFQSRADSFDRSTLSKVIAKDMHIKLRAVYENMVREDERKQENVSKIKVMRVLQEVCLSSVSSTKVAILKHGLGFLKAFMKDETFRSLWALAHKLELITFSQVFQHKIGNCSFFYIAKTSIPHIFEKKIKNESTCKRLQYLFDALEDSANLIKNCPHLDEPPSLLTEYKRELL